MATKKQIAQVMKSAIDEAASNPLNMKPPTIEDMYEHALGVNLGEATKAQMHEEWMKANAEVNAFFKQLENIEPISIQIAKAIQATQSGGGATPATPKRKRIKHIRYPQDNEARKALEEAARRKRCKSYSGDSNADIIKHMIEEPESKWAARILYGKLKGKANGQGRKQTKPLDKDKAAKTWGKHLSAYLKDRPPKQGA